MPENVRAGIHHTAQTNIDTDFSKKEAEIVRRWSDLWFITSAGKRTVNKSDYKFMLAKPTSTVEEAFGITQEIVIVFSPYSNFEARTLEAYDYIVSDLIEQRYEKICYVLISADEQIETKLKDYLTNQENQIIVPFSYVSFGKNKTDPHFIRNQFRRYFYSRDLFDYSEPLKKDTFFFGRNEIVTQIISKHRSGQNYGLFGLRKTGKTSIIYDILRKSETQGFIAINIDCQNPSFNMRRWNRALFFVIDELCKQCNFEWSVNEEDFSIENASHLFQEYIKKISSSTGKRILIMFDEIENITFGKSSAEHWCHDLDFVFFWQSIRSTYQTTSDIFTFCILGTNPKCVEESTILGKDNPIFNAFQPAYIPGFTYEQTREMVRKLGRIMGIMFDEGVYTRLVEDYGGHPFLIRRVCSKIAQLNSQRPVTIDRNKYAEAKRAFNLENMYFDMILEVLTQFYADEYEMLTCLAMNDRQTFDFYVQEDGSIVNHLLGYGLIRKTDDGYDFNLDAIKDFLLRKSGNHMVLTTDAEKWKHLCAQRNELEIRLRKMVKSIVKVAHKNEATAREYVLTKLFSNEPKYRARTYSELFESRDGKIFLKGLTDLIKSDWDYFSDYFGKQDVFIVHMNVLNAEGRFDAHASIPDTAEITAVDNSASFLRKAIEKYERSLE